MMNEINTPEKLYQYMKNNIEYGFVSKYGTKFLRNEIPETIYMNNIFKNYYFQSPEELFKSKCGICFDQVEFAKNILGNNGYNVKSFYTKIHNHVFLVYEFNDKYYYYERCFKDNNGIYSFNTLKELFEYYLSIQKDNKLDQIEFFEYDNIKYGSNFDVFISSVKKQNNIKMVLKRN